MWLMGRLFGTFLLRRHSARAVPVDSASLHSKLLELGSEKCRRPQFCGVEVEKRCHSERWDYLLDIR